MALFLYCSRSRFFPFHTSKNTPLAQHQKAKERRRRRGRRRKKKKKMLSSPRCVVAFSQRTTTTTSARHRYVVREKKITTNNSNNASGPRCRRSHRRYGRAWWVTSSSSTNGEDAEGEKKTSWKVVSESPFASSNSDSSLASEQPALRIEAESSSSASRVDGGDEDDEDDEEEMKGIPINSSRRTTKMLFTCNKCGTFLARSNEPFAHSLSIFLSLSLVTNKNLTFTPLFFLSFVRINARAGIRTERRVNKQNLTTGTTWVQCGNPSCSVWHKIVDTLGLIYECSEMD